MKPIISVVVPAYNEEKLLAKCLSALKNQDFDKTFEVIVVDNCSTDKTPEIGKKFGFRVIYEPKKGQIFAKQRGCMEAKGDIIAVLDADNIPAKDWISVIYKELTGEVGDVVAITNTCSKDGNIPLWYKIHDKFLTRPFFKIEHKIIRSGRVTGGNAAFFRKTFLDVGGYDINNSSILETEIGLSSRLSKKGRIKHVPKMIVFTDIRVIERGIFIYFYRYYVKGLFNYFMSKFHEKPVLSDSRDFR
ncbi:MAG: glycosyltransferase family 2 protein [Candidatus Aenigmarchaeota archaeon]|nr:glycosyltransferase family 2 protein [Candidatus Aenigmarchaeota archaeon]